MAEYRIHKFPRSRIATIDICSIGIQKHHISALLEIDVSVTREKLKRYQQTNHRISFTAWLIKVIGNTIQDYENVSGYLQGKRKVMIFKDINVSILVEKDLNGEKIPIPVLIEKVNKRDIVSIDQQLSEAKNQKLTNKDIVLNNQSKSYERLYYFLPGFLRRYIWQFLLWHPKIAFKKMGNVAVTSIKTKGKTSGWFIPISIHPLCFGVGNIAKKPVVINDQIEIREILNMTVLLDHDVIDGAHMARFLSQLSDNIENGTEL